MSFQFLYFGGVNLSFYAPGLLYWKMRMQPTLLLVLQPPPLHWRSCIFIVDLLIFHFFSGAQVISLKNALSNLMGNKIFLSSMLILLHTMELRMAFHVQLNMKQPVPVKLKVVTQKVKEFFNFWRTLLKSIGEGITSYNTVEHITRVKFSISTFHSFSFWRFKCIL